MSLSIKTNVGALSAQQNISANDREKQRLFARLSSGSRINSAQDDAAGLAIAVDLAAQLGSGQQAVRNGNDALNVTDTADAALGQAGDIVGQLRELAMASGSGALNYQQRGDLQLQASALTSELDRIANSTEYNGTALLNGGGSLGFQVGTGGDPSKNQISLGHRRRVDERHQPGRRAQPDQRRRHGAAGVGSDEEFDPGAGRRGGPGAGQPARSGGAASAEPLNRSGQKFWSRNGFG